MNDLMKLRALIPHWIEHNQEHAREFLRWAEEAGNAGEAIRRAANSVEKANQALEQALGELGGPLDHPHQH
jgi:hypothetical protein